MTRDPRERAARRAGVAYLLLIITGAFSVVYMPARLFVRDDMTQTAANILASQSLFTGSVVSALLSLVVFMSVVFLLHRMLAEVDRSLAALMVILVLIQVPVGIVDVMDQVAALELLRGDDFLSGIDGAQRNALAGLLLDLNERKLPVVELLWGLWLFPLGLLVVRSGFLPRFLGWWLIANGVAYAVLSLVGLAAPRYTNVLMIASIPALLAEVAFMLWLLIRGAAASTPARMTEA